MKHVWLIILILTLLTAVLLISIPFVNDYTTARLEKALLNAPLPDGAVLIDHASAAGKLIGNGNGMQYLAVIVIRTDLSFDELEAHYSALRSRSDDFLVLSATETNRLPNDKLDLLPQYPNDAYLIYTWGASNFPLRNLDLRAH